jgi:uncharacterized protein (DUF362 family)
MISLLIDTSLEYPDACDFFSPDELFPEYRFNHLASVKNPVYRAVRQCLAQSGLDQEHFGTPLWNPLGRFIQPGNRVFVLCNFASERREKELLENYQARCTHGSVLRALVDYILIAVGQAGTVSFGNAPVQFCRWDSVLDDTGARSVFDFYQSRGVPIQSIDLRLFVNQINSLGASIQVERRPDTGGIPVNLGGDSLLAELDRYSAHRFRIMNYNPKRINFFHSHGSHTYIINRHILESDVIFSLPKLKTHEKVGISCALKGFVGTVGHKDSLPHHRFGSPRISGDEYPQDKTGLLQLQSVFHEQVQQTKPDSNWGRLLRVTYRVIRRITRRWAPITEGAWWGNDTAWRMVLDLVKISTYASSRGELQTIPCRKHFVLIDGIYGGEGEGPAYPTAVRSGVLLFSDNLAATDYVNCILMGFDPLCIPLVRESLNQAKYPLLHGDLTSEQIVYNGQPTAISELTMLEKHHFEPPPGWKGKMTR